MRTIVIIEDDTNAQEVYQQIFAQNGIRAFFASTGQLGIQLVQSEMPDLIVLDLVLAGAMNGMDVLKALKHYPALQAIPVLVVTNLQSEKNKAIEQGAVDVLVKASTSIDELVGHIKKHARTRKVN